MLQAIIHVESRGRGFLDTGQPIILFERHIFYRHLKKKGIDAQLISQQHPQICASQTGGYLGGIKEHQRLTQAKQIDENSAIASCSWGLFQIMGFHWQMLGYPSPQVFEQKMSDNESLQLEAFLKFICHPQNSGMFNALKTKDFQRFARLYNGPAYQKNQYDKKLKQAYDHYQTLI